MGWNDFIQIGIFLAVFFIASRVEKMLDAVNEINERAYKSFQARYGEPPDDPDALEAYLKAQDREGL